MKKRAMNGFVAISFLVIICVLSLFLIIKLIIPAIQAQDIPAENEASLRINSLGGKTVYDSSDGFAIIEIKRGIDGLTLHGMELIINFDDVAYRTSLRAPAENSSKSYIFDLNSMKKKGLVPTIASVAPIFIIDGRERLGEISSEGKISISKINNLDLLIEQLKESGEVVYEINEGVYEVDYLSCDGEYGLDPWGGCPEYVGKIYSINNLKGDKSFDFDGPALNWAGKYVRFKSLGGEESECIIDSPSCDSIVNLISGGSWSEMENYAVLGSSEGLTATTGIIACEDYDYFYIYKSSSCE